MNHNYIAMVRSTPCYGVNCYMNGTEEVLSKKQILKDSRFIYFASAMLIDQLIKTFPLFSIFFIKSVFFKCVIERLVFRESIEFVGCSVAIDYLIITMHYQNQFF